MRKFKYIYWAGALILTLLTTNAAVAQEAAKSSSPASIELLKARSLWFNTNNGAGLTLDNLYTFSDLNFMYNLKSGDFKKNQEGEKESQFGVSTEGGVKLGGGYAWGSFSYDNETQKNALFNTTMLDPDRGVPFYTVDQNLSEWKKQNYKLEMNVASKLLYNRYIVGIQGEYIARTGAKQIDPRSVADYYSITVKPGVVALFGDHKIGLNAVYKNMIQESSHTNSNSQQHQDVYVVKGVGNFYSAVVGGLQGLGRFVYNANTLGGDLQYSYSFSDISLLLSGHYSLRVEDVISDPTKPKKEGSVKEDLISANLKVIKQGVNLNTLEISYSNSQSSGIEYVQILDNSPDVRSWVDVYSSIRSGFDNINMTLKYDFFKGAEHEYKWRAGVVANYRDNDDIYFLPRSKMRVENLFIGINAKRNIPLKLSDKLILGADVTYKNNLNGYYFYNGADPDSPVITQFMTPDFEYMKRDYIKVGGEISYFTRVSKSSKSGVFLKIAADYYKPIEGEGNRMQTSFGLGFTF
ncbi:MAG: hypothetical protein Q8R90_02775 [Bacteroidales bacterium]|nr:hypothetical protein [Bacteroidales bacterium]